MVTTCLNPSDLKALAGIGYRNAVMALQKAFEHGKKWRGEKLVVRQVERDGGKTGYQVRLDSLPKALRKRWASTGSDGEDVIEVDSGMDAAPETPETEERTASPSRTGSPDGYTSESLWALWETAGVRKQEVAETRLEIILEVERRAANGENKEAVANELGAPKRTYYNWLAMVYGKARADWLPALLPGHQGGSTERGYAPQIFEAFKAYYLHHTRRPLEYCYQLTADEAKAQEWGELPCLKTLQRRMLAEISPQAIEIARYGQNAAAWKKTAPTVIRDRRGMRALEEVNGDGWEAKFYVTFPDGEEVHPTIWFWQDSYSGKLLAWYADKTENSDMLRLSLRELYLRAGMGTNGEPFRILIDNTRAASAKIFTGRMVQRHRFKMREDEPLGLFPKLGHDYRPALPESGRSKPVERKFGKGGMSDYFDKAPEFDGARDKGKGVSWETFQTVLEREVNRLNSRVSKSLVCGGVKSPDDVYAESLGRCTVLKATEQQLNMLLLCAIGVTARPPVGEVHFLGNVYHHEALYHWSGKKVALEYDPGNLHAAVNILTLEGRMICTAECQMAVGHRDSDAARQTKKLERRAKKRFKQEIADNVQLSALERAGRLPLPDAQPDAEELAAAVQNIAFNGRQAAVKTTEEDEVPAYNAEVIELLGRKSRKAA